MKGSLLLIVFLVALVGPRLAADTFGTGANQFEIEFVTIGDTGNVADDTGYGSVDYEYRISKYEISRAMVDAYNAEGAGPPITLHDMFSYGGTGGDKPAMGINWNEAARFVNWLNTSKGHPVAYKFTTSGANDNLALWAATDAGYDPANPFRNRNARYVLPSEDEWYKAAYYDPSAGGGSGRYWDYATGSDTAPAVVAGGTTPGTAVYNSQAAPAEIMNAGGLSPYGTMAQNGNAMEHIESAFTPPNDSPSEDRVRRGGSFLNLDQFLPSSGRQQFSTTVGEYMAGFRVASVASSFATSQTIGFEKIDDQFASAGTVPLCATSSSGLPVSYEIVSEGAIASLSGSDLILTGATGIVTVRASQGGTEFVDPAEDIYRTFTVFDETERFTTVATGVAYSIGVRADGTLWGWGRNSYGQLGDGTTTDRAFPVQVGSATNWTSVVCGWDHSVALKSDGTLWAWGRNEYGEVGDGSGVQRVTPVQIGSANDWVEVACGHYHTLARRSNGALWVWGRNNKGQLGDGTTDDRLSPVQVPGATNWVELAGGWEHSLARKADNTLWAWGENQDGRLGDGTTTDRISPVQVGSDNDWQEVACGRGHSMARRTDGTVWAWGANNDGQLGEYFYPNDVRVNPGQVGTSDDWIAISCADDSSGAIRADGTLWSWGQDWGGSSSEYSPTQIGSEDIWAELSVGRLHTVAIRENGTLWTWGSGPLRGDGSAATEFRPAQVGIQSDWVEFFRRSDGSIWRLLGGAEEPERISFEYDWVEVESGSGFYVARKENGTIWAKGNNVYGQLGQGHFLTVEGWIQVGTEDDWVEISCGVRHTIGRRSDGSLWAWGANNYGQLGNGDSGPSVKEPSSLLK